MKRSQAYYTVRAIVRGIFWAAVTITIAATIWAAFVAVAITEQESWK